MTSSKIDLRFYTTRPGAAGSVRRFWQPTGKMKKAGWELERLPDDEGQAVARVRELNTRYDNAQNGRGPAGNYAVLPDQLAAARAAAIASGDAVGDNHPPVEMQAQPRIHSQAPRGSIGWLIDQWYRSIKWTAKPGSTVKPYSKATRRQYRKAAETIRKWAQNGNTAVRALTPVDVQNLYDAFLPHSHHWANALIGVLHIILEHGRKKIGLIEVNAADRPGLLALPPRLRIIDHAEQAALIAHADALGLYSIGDAIAIGHDIGQRQADILSMTRMRYRDGRIFLRQRKTSALVDIEVSPRVADRMTAAMARVDRMYAGQLQAAQAMGRPAPVPPAQLVISESTGRKYSGDNFRQIYARVRAAAAGARYAIHRKEAYTLWNDDDLARTAHLRKAPSLLGRPADAEEPDLQTANFQDLRDTCVTNMAEGGATIPQICAVTGHSEKNCFNILKHYLALNREMAKDGVLSAVSLYQRREAERLAAERAAREEEA
jgi:hypothetical protein